MYGFCLIHLPTVGRRPITSKLLALIVTSNSGSASLTGPRGTGNSADEFGGSEQHARQRTPRKSLIVALPDNHWVSAEEVAARVAYECDTDAVDVILACAGQPHVMSALQTRIRDLQILLAPAGTSLEEL